MMLFIFAAKEQKDPVKPSSDEVTEACLVPTTESSGSSNKRGH